MDSPEKSLQFQPLASKPTSNTPQTESPASSQIVGEEGEEDIMEKMLREEEQQELKNQKKQLKRRNGKIHQMQG